MKVRLAGEIDARWRHELAAALPEAQWCDDGDAELAVVANPPPGALAGMPSLALVQSLWAGVDRLLADATLPPGVPVARMVDPAMNAAMAETATWAVLALHRGFFDYAARQREGRWQPHAQRRADEVAVLVLGRGEMGGTVGARLAALGYRVEHWHRGRELAPLLAGADIVVNLLPLTPATRDLIDARFLAALPAGASLVNLGRGAHVVEADLLAALDAGTLQHAVLDVFRHEPLPPGHAFWAHPRVTVLPHAAAATDPRSASAVVAANLRAWRDGRPVAHLVDRGRGY
ncbi:MULTISPECIES: glyoxylate/hydroxypyruvate reductase A [unclassified Rubrivivax]|uniref:2-hydroxyacid dehydrogenase n=1 Tax=unclassified Rubrivivax TaxID=2649762 RepID=UPI001E297821|nr:MULTISPECIES: glyoxylate/hydroxypyruvate reductase A [unclassified Rubrivivax]MCC9596574.1 glyoxylate/hydroxypyruvate reductase A [Rubrivivax sp. JA1055]MCC9648730.1 glyoxylate/hydroxypyruvate reductase A [Rubrivivax sp. JA1029]